MRTFKKQSVAKYCDKLPSIAKYYTISQSNSRVLQSIAEYCKVLQSIAMLYKVVRFFCIAFSTTVIRAISERKTKLLCPTTTGLANERIHAK